MSGPRYARAPRLMWRLADDRVLVRRVGAAGAVDDAAADLFGAAAMVWVALDEARTLDEVAAEVTAAVAPSGAEGSLGALHAAVDELVEQGFVVEVAP